ncbi:hypothetical protein KR018_001604, partial [Drosophila ironensis]
EEKATLRDLLKKFMLSGREETQLTDLSSNQRRYLHTISTSLGLKTSSTGPRCNRIMTVTWKERDSQNASTLTVSGALQTVLMGAQASLKAVIHSHANKNGSTNGDGVVPFELHKRASNMNLVGVPMVPPPPNGNGNPLAQTRRDLPIFQKRRQILNELRKHQVLIIQGSTGSGKSTQVPQYLLEEAAMDSRKVRIVITQPRRIAAVTLAERIAQERGEVLGNTVGYQIRMESQCSLQTVLTLTTSGCIMRVLAVNGVGLFANTTHLIIDEVHERDLDTDFLLLATKKELKRNPKLRVVLMSATMDLNALSAYFDNAKIMDIEGRTFPVKIFHLEDILENTGYMTQSMAEYLDAKSSDSPSPEDLLQAYTVTLSRTNSITDNDLVVSLLEMLLRTGQTGAVMVYLTGFSEMSLMRERVEALLPRNQIKVLLLHSKVDNSERRRAFEMFPNIRLKIILSTNIGQTSITVPDLLFVIDLGRAKMNTYDPVSDSTQLARVWISQADAMQRAGRAGRVRSGICYRIYSKARFESFDPYPIPEMKRRTLEEICLLAKLAAPDQPIASFLSEALEPPQQNAVSLACSRLKLLCILDDDTEAITPLGRLVAEFPVGVQMSRCVIHSIYYRCLGSMTIIAAYHSVREPFIMSHERHNQGRSVRLAFVGDTNSDSMLALNLYNDYNACPSSQVARFCEEHHLCRANMEMFVAAVNSLRDTVKRIFRNTGNSFNIASEADSDLNMVRLALTTGLYTKVAFKSGKGRRCLIAEGDSYMQIARFSCLQHLKKEATTSYWVLYVEKTRLLDGTSAVEYNTIVSELLLALGAGKKVVTKQDQEGAVLYSIDNWVTLRMPSDIGAALVDLRKVIAIEMAQLVGRRCMGHPSSWVGPKLVRAAVLKDINSQTLSK